MGLFGKKERKDTCGNCLLHVRTSGRDFCINGAPERLNIRMLSLRAMEEQFTHCPEDLQICPDFIPRQQS